jgi:hypothetical protein
MSLTSRNLAVGTTLEQAAEAFGGLFREVELTTYAEVGDHVDLELLGSLSLVSGASSDALLPGIVAQHHALGQAAPPVYVGREGAVVEVLHGTAPAPLLVTTPHPSPDGTRDGTSVSATPPGRRRPTARQLLAGGIGVGVVLLLVVALAGALGGMAWALLVLGLEILGAQAGLLAGVAYAVLLLRRHVAHDEEDRVFREQLTHRSGRLLEHARENVARQRRRFDSLDRAVADLRGTRDRVDALSRLVSREQARSSAPEVSGDRESS